MGNAKIKAPATLFLPFQKRWIEDNSRLKIAEKSRQIGFTWCTAYADTLTTARQSNRHDLWITSRDEIQAQLYLSKDVKGWADLYNIAARDYGEQVVMDDRGRSHKVSTCTFANGCTIYSLSSNADAQAGKRGNRRADEFALNPKNRHLYDIMKPGTTWGGQMWIWSTHRGSQNFFNQLIQEIREGGNPKGFSLHRITLEDALNEGLLDKLQQKWEPDDPRQEWDEAEYFDSCRREQSSEESFLEEYMCQPSDDAGAYISYDLIDACLYPPGTAWETELDPAGTYYLGFDVGRTTDLSIIYIVEADGSARRTRRLIEMSNTKFADQRDTLYRYLSLPCIRRACIDATGLGMQLAEEARDRFGAKVEPVTFTAGVKEDMATTTRRAMEDAALRIPNDPKLITDIRSIRKETTSAGNVRYVGERTTNGHADRWWAIGLALHAGKQPGTCGPSRLSTQQPGRRSRFRGARHIGPKP